MFNQSKNIIATVALFGALTGSLPGTVEAQIKAPAIAAPLAGFENLNELFSSGLSIVLIVSALAVLFYFFIGGFTYLTAGSNEDQTKKARLIITNAVIGLILVSATWVIWLFIIGFIPGLSGLLGQ